MTSLRNFSPVDEALRIRYDGDESVVQGIDCLAVPVIPISDEQMDFELRYLARVFEASGYAESAAVVGEESLVGILNPADSGSIIVVERIKTWTESGVAPFEVRSGVAALVPDTNVAGSFRDLRASGASVGRILTASVAGTFASLYPTLHYAGTSPVNVVHESEDGWVIPPGRELWVAGTLANVERHAVFAWRERVLGADERASLG